MVGDGLFPSELLRPLPLSLGARHLAQILQGLDRPPQDRAAEQLGEWCLLRLEVPVVAPGPKTSVVLSWLQAQAGHLPRTLFATRDGAGIVAGAGSAHTHRWAEAEEGPGGQLLPKLTERTHERIRYIGGVRFDASDARARGAAPEWESFGRCCWVLPRVELSAGDARAPLRPSNTQESPNDGSDLASSSTSTTASLTGLEETSAGRLVAATLAVQLRWRAGQEGSWAEERRAALDALRRIRPCAPRGAAPYRGALLRRSEAVSQDAFAKCVKDALEAFKDGSLQKVVLARRAQLEVTEPLDAVGLLRHVVGDVHKRHYLFLLEVVEGAAFVSLTPERLCRVQGADIWTEAVAGTWPIAEFEKIGEAALLTSSAKHSNEHQLVVDYIYQLLGHVSRHIKVCDTHILKLKHLVHIKKSYHAIAKEDGSQDGSKNGASKASDPLQLTAFFCERMSPTPAVCGLPLAGSQDFIRAAEPWDRGFYAAPCGIINSQGSEITVALRSALLCDERQLYVYAGAGIVPGSDPAEEFAEISLKMRQFTEAFPPVHAWRESAEAWVGALAQLPNMNTLWASLVVEECARLGVTSYVICPGSRSTPLVVAVARHPHTMCVVNHDERGAAFYALGWAKAVGAPVAVIVTSGTAVANLLPAAVEAAQAHVPLLLLTADRPPELRDTGANQTIVQPGIFGTNVRWGKDMPCPSTEYPAHALLGDIDLAVAHATGALAGRPGPVHLNFCFRENLAPDGGAVRGAPGRTSEWDARYVQTAEMYRWAGSTQPRSTYVALAHSLQGCGLLQELVALVRSGRSRIVVLVGSLRDVEEALAVEDLASRLGAAVFADVTSGLRQRPGTVHYADQLLHCPLLAGDLLQLDALLHVGGAVCSARLGAFAKAAAPRLHVRVAPAPVRLDADHTVTHHLPCALPTLAEALIEAGLQPTEGPPAFWKRLSDAAGEVLDAMLSPCEAFTEPFVAHAVSRLLQPGSHLQISSSMPVRDLDFFSRPCADASVPPNPPMANRGASGIDGVLSTAVGFCRGAGVPTTLVIGDVAALHDLNALQQLSGPEAPRLVVVVVNNGGAGIFSFLPIARHEDVLGTFFSEPHELNFADACQAFAIPHFLCETTKDFEATYLRSQAPGFGGACVIEARVTPTHAENVALHKALGEAVAARVRSEILSQVRLGWHHTSGAAAAPDASYAPPFVLLHGWLGEKADWADVTRRLVEAKQDVLAIDLPGHGAAEVGTARLPDPWEAAALFSLPVCVGAVADLLERLRIPPAVLVGYSLGGRVAMALAAAHPDRVAGLLALSANPGLKSAGERAQRWQGDAAIAVRLGRERLENFLDGWYAAPLWARLAERRPEVYRAMLAKRKRSDAHLAALSLLGMSLARQPSLWPSEGGGAAWHYAYGALDHKFAEIGAELDRRLTGGGGQTGSRVVSVADAGHALVEECPGEVADLCLRVGKAAQPATMPPKPLDTQLRLTAVWSEPIELALKAPLLLSRGDPMPKRSGLLVVVQAHDPRTPQSQGLPLAGLGEVCPLPQFHRETLPEAEAQLNAVLCAWAHAAPAVPPTLARLDGALGRWLAEHCPSGASLLPSVRAGLEMALLHLLGRVTGASRLGAAAAAAHGTSCRSDVGVNGLIAREEDLDAGGATVLKVKVGKDPVEDGRRTNHLAQLLQSHRGPCARLRLDANQAWTVDQAATFVAELSDQAVAITEYLEEPVQWTAEGPESFLGSWEVLAERTQGRVCFAVDESLTETTLSTQHLEACKAPIAALVLKPALQGLEQTIALAAWAVARGMRPVVSSAFESGVALSHFAILAGAMAEPPWLRENKVSSSHGLGTFTRLAEDVLCPPFADLVCSHGGGGWRVDLLRCREALDRTADALVASKEPQTKRAAWA